MDTLSAFAMGEANRDKEQRVFDWDRARALIAEHGAQTAVAGLQSDMEWTSGPIWENGAPVPREETYTYLASTWAIPVLVLDDGPEIECWRMASETPGWDAKTYWPEPALLTRLDQEANQ